MWKRLLVFIMPVLLLSACTYTSGVKTFATQLPGGQGVEKQEIPIAASDAQGLILKAIDASHSDKALRYWFDGYIANNIQKRRITNMYNGVIIRPNTLFVSASLMGQSYRYLRKDEKAFFFDGESWTRESKQEEPLDPTRGFTDWIPFLDKATKLKEEKVLNTICIPIHIKVSGTEWVQKNSSVLFQDMKQMMNGRADLDVILKNTEVETTIWISKKDNLLTQYKTTIKMPIPSAGYMDQEISFRFIKYNDPGITIPDINEIESSIKK